MTEFNSMFFVNPTSYPTSSNPYASYQQPPRPVRGKLFSDMNPALSQPKLSFPSSIPTSTFTTPLRRSQLQLSQTTVSNENMKEEIEYFKILSQQQFIKKASAIGISLAILSIFGIVNSKICFELALVALALMMNDTLVMENITVRAFVNTLPTLTYTALFYDILTEGNHAGHYYIALANLPALIVAIAAMANFLFFKKLSFLSEQNIRSVRVNLSSLDTLQYFYKRYLQRVKSNFKLTLYVLALNCCLALLFVVYCLANLNNELFLQTVYTLPAGFVCFLLIDLYIYTVEFMSKEFPLFTLKKHFYQVQVCMSLLRLRSNQFNHQQNSKIQQRCLNEIAKELKHNADFLETPVKINYAINTYRDIFEVYASQQLTYLQSAINEIVLNIFSNNKIAQSKKTWKQDLFISLRKLYAKLENNFLILRILSQIEKRKLTFLIMVRLSQGSPLRTKILESLNDVKQSTKRATNAQEYFQIGQRKLKDWIKELQNLQKTLRNESTILRLSNISQVDTHGWAHYNRHGHLDIQSA